MGYKWSRYKEKCLRRRGLQVVMIQRKLFKKTCALLGQDIKKLCKKTWALFGKDINIVV